MKVFITGNFYRKSAKPAIEGLSKAVRDAGMMDVSFMRDVEGYKRPRGTAKEKWLKVYDEMAACDVLLVDMGESNDRRAVECGMALALKKPIVITVKRGTKHKKLFDDMASKVIEYDSYKDITQQLKKYEKDRSFSVNDKLMLIVILAFFGLGSAWWVSQFFVPLAGVWLVAYWMMIRIIFPLTRSVDRVAMYIPLVGIWLAGMVLFLEISHYLAWAWALIYWFAVVIVLQRMKRSL